MVEAFVMLARRSALIVLTLVCGLATSTHAAFAVTDAPPPTLKLSRLDGKGTPLAFTVEVDVKGATSAKLIVDGVYIGKVDQAPLAFDVRVTPGKHQLRVRSVVDGIERRSYAAITASANPPPTAETSPAPPLASRRPRPTSEAAPRARTSR